MKKIKFTDWEWLSLRVLILGFTIFLWSYLSDLNGFHDFMEDKYSSDNYFSSDNGWTWGFRHWVYFFTFLILTGIQAVKIIKWVRVSSKCKDSFPVGGECTEK